MVSPPRVRIGTMLLIRPMVVLAGSSDQPQESMGAFQEFPQVEAARLFSKYAARIPTLDRVPFFVEKVCSDQNITDGS